MLVGVHGLTSPGFIQHRRFVRGTNLVINPVLKPTDHLDYGLLQNCDTILPEPRVKQGKKTQLCLGDSGPDSAELRLCPVTGNP